MPLINYVCECKYSASKFQRRANDAPAFVLCPRCGKDAKRAMKAPASTSVVTVDNGVQSRAVEINLDIVEDIKERSGKDPREQ